MDPDSSSRPDELRGLRRRPPAQPAAPWRTRVVLVAVVVALLLSTLAWLRIDTAPPLWDSADYLQHSAVLYRALTQGGVPAFLAAFSTSMDRKAPLIAALPLPFFAVFGESYTSARYVNLLWIIVSSGYLFCLGRRLLGNGTAVLAVLVLQTFPLVAGMSRQFLVEYGLMTVVVVWMHYLLRWRDESPVAAPWILGLLLGFGLLLKVTLPLYVTVPTLLAARQKRAGGCSLRGLGLDLARMSLVALPIAALWYARNLAAVTGFLLDAGFGEAGSAYGTGPAFTLAAIGKYWLNVVNNGISGLYAILFAVFLVAAGVLAARRSPGLRATAGMQDSGLLLAWCLVPFAVLTFAANKDVRYTIPFLPAVALLFAATAKLVLPAGGRRAAFPAIAALGALNFAVFSFGIPWMEHGYRVGGLVLLSERLGWAHPPEADPWPDEEVMLAVARDAARLHRDRVRVRVLFSHPRINAHVLNYLATLRDESPRFTTVHFQSHADRETLIAEINSGYDYLLTKSGSPGPERINQRNREMAIALGRGELAFREVLSIALPDGTSVSIHRRTAYGP